MTGSRNSGADVPITDLRLRREMTYLLYPLLIAAALFATLLSVASYTL
jgi:hypothetical protein